MPKESLAQFGQRVKSKYPGAYDDKADEEVGAAMLKKHPEYSDRVEMGGGPVDPNSAASRAANPFASSPAHPPSPPMSAPSLMDTLDRATERVPGSPNENVAKGMTRKLAHSVVDPFAAAESEGKKPLTTRLKDGVMEAAGGPAVGIGKSVYGLGKSAYDAHQNGGVEAGLEDLTSSAGSAAVQAVLGEMAPDAADAAATGLNKGGRLSRQLGSKVSGFTVAAPPPEETLGADTGRALSQNRIVGTSPRSLASKVKSRIDPAVESRNRILSSSSAAPTDISEVVHGAYDDIAIPKTDPKTGAVNPAGIGKMARLRDAITHVQDPDSGAITQTPKDPNLTPAEMGRLQTNVYDLADYSTEENDLANQFAKATGKGIKDKINEVAPEAGAMTDTIHDLLGARDHLKSKTGAPPGPTDLSPTKLLGKMYDRAKYGTGTAIGAGLDLAGSGMQSASGLLRKMAGGGGSPVAPVPSAPPAQHLLPSEAIANADMDVEDATGGGAGGSEYRPHPSPVAPAPPASPRGLLPQMAGEGRGDAELPPVGNLHPGAPNPSTARTRISPNQLPPASQQVLEDQPGFVAPKGTRKLIMGEDGQIRPEPYTLPVAPRAPLQLESRTGPRAPSQRPSLLRQLRREAGDAGVQREVEMEMSRRKVQGQPVATSVPEPAPVTPALAPAPPAPAPRSTPARPSPSPARSPGSLPAPNDFDGWMDLVDQGKAEYDAARHEFRYTGPVASVKKTLKDKVR